MDQQNQNNLFPELGFDLTARQHLRSLASWSMIIVVVALIGYVISIISLYTQPEQVSTMSEGFDVRTYVKANSTSSVVLQIVIGLLVNYFLFRFASQVRTGIDGLNQANMASSFKNLKSFFMAMSILLIIGLALLMLFVAIIIVSPPERF